MACADGMRFGARFRLFIRVVETVVLENCRFVPCRKKGGFDENWQKCWYCILPQKQGNLLLKPRKSTKMTEMAGVTPAKWPFAKSTVLTTLILGASPLARGDHPNSRKNAPRMEGQMKIFHVGSRQFRESLRELLRELWVSYCSSREMPFREWNFAFRESLFEFRELLREYPGTLPELREWPFHSESVFSKIGVVPMQASEAPYTPPRRKILPTRPPSTINGKLAASVQFLVGGLQNEAEFHVTSFRTSLFPESLV